MRVGAEKARQHEPTARIHKVSVGILSAQVGRLANSRNQPIAHQQRATFNEFAALAERGNVALAMSASGMAAFLC
jgi:hypothetical protein